MSRARPVYKNVSLMLTRRVRLRTFLLRPSERIDQVVKYVVAVMLKKWSMKLHALQVMSNHWHPVLTDPQGNVVKFQRDCHAFIARAVNAGHGEFESVWDSQQTSRVECETPEDLVGKIAYVMANPVEAGLVRYGKSWPGVRCAWPRKPEVIRKPAFFFRGVDEGGTWPEEAVLELSRPPGFDHLSDEELAEHIRAAVDRREKSIRRAFDAAGRRFLGRRAVLEQRRHDRPRTDEPRFGISPRVACRDRWRRVERLAADKEWLRAYDGARTRWVGGDRSVIFPAGTYQLRVEHGVTCALDPG